MGRVRKPCTRSSISAQSRETWLLLTPSMPRARAAHPDRRLTLWFQDGWTYTSNRFGQKGRVCHRWFVRGQRPPGLCDQRCTWAHLFAVVRPATGQDFALVSPHVPTAAMSVFLERFAKTLAEDEHAVLVLDRAGWRTAKRLRVPDSMTLVRLPPYSPDLNLIERVWLHLRERHLSHRLLDGYEAIADALCQAWRRLTAERLQSLTSYNYTEQVRI